MTDDRRREERVPASVRVRLQYPTVETFVERYATNVSRGGIFIQSQRTQPSGTTIRFEFQISDKSPVIRGEGKVVWAVPFDPAHPERVYGMGVRFTRLDIRSKRVIDDMISQRLARGEADPGAAPPTPETAQLDDTVVRVKARTVGEPAPAIATALASAAAATPLPPPTPVPEPRPGDLGAPDPSPVRGPDLSFGADVRVEIGPLVERILGRRRISADEADALLSELEANGAGKAARVATAKAARAVRPVEAAPTSPYEVAPTPRAVAAPIAAGEAERAAAAEEAAGEPEAAVPQAAVDPVIADLFEESYTGPLPTPGEENEPGSLPELREVPELVAEPNAAPADEEELVESELIENDVAAELEAAELEELSETGTADVAGTEGEATEEQDITSLFEDVEGEQNDLLSALDEPLEDNLMSRPPAQVMLDDVDLDAPIVDDFSAHARAETTETEAAPELEAAELEPESDVMSEADAEPATEDLKPKKGFFKKLFGK